MGVSSYLLIGFWYEKASAADAAKKAFLTNRLGDFGFILGILMVLDGAWFAELRGAERAGCRCAFRMGNALATVGRVC